MAKDTVVIGISISRRLLGEIDKLCKGVPRSRYISNALITHLRSIDREKEAAIRAELRLIESTVIMTAEAAREMIPIICTGLNLDPEIQESALKLAERSAEEDLGSAVLTRGLAAAAVYVSAMFSGFPLTQREVAHVTAVSEVTVRNRMKEMYKTFDLSSAVASPHGLIQWLDRRLAARVR